MRTYLYKLTSDRGGAPCAPPPLPGDDPLLSLSICKPAIRRTAQVGDRIVGITSHALAHAERYPLLAVIYAAIVGETLQPQDYYAEAGPFGSRPDCIYAFHREQDRLVHAGRSRLHADPRYAPRDIGRYPFYRNARTLLAHEFRYFGAHAVRIPPRLALLTTAAETLGQGHRVYDHTDPASREFDALFKLLWKRPTHFTPASVEEEARGHTPK